jgi:prepilin-type N-terminal cleavage/methylation domain-containing protein
MMLTFTVQTQISNQYYPFRKRSGFTLIEAMVALAVASLLIVLGAWNLAGPLQKNTFRAKAQKLASTMQKAAIAASQTGRRFEVIIDLVEQQYTLRQISSDNLTYMLEEEIITIEDFSENCQVYYVEFDDPEEEVASVDQNTETLQAKFRAGPSGWQYGGKIVLIDEQDRLYTVVISTLSRMVTLKEGDIVIPKSKRADEIPF